MEKEIILTLIKPRSPYRIEVIVNREMNSDGEDWFLDFNHVLKSTGAIKYSSTIIRKDLDQWVDFHIRDGWKKS